MSVQNDQVTSAIRRLATTTCLVALLPISMGALVTTLKAGMAFADWPSSDGHNMLLYPWFSDFASNPEKFTEHGHRLAGMLIGFVSVILAIAGWFQHQQWVRRFTFAILLAVVLQGLLGGARVLMDRQLLAMIHSITGATFFAMCVVFRLLCSSRWPAWVATPDVKLSSVSVALVAVTPVAVAGQYFLGGMLRHLHLFLNEHLFGAVAVSVLCVSAALCLLRSEHPLLHRCGVGIAAALVFQLLLGAGSYVSRFGLPSIGYVATSGSMAQAVVCSLHTVFGMGLFASSVVSAVSLASLYKAGCLRGLNLSLPVLNDQGRVA